MDPTKCPISQAQEPSITSYGGKISEYSNFSPEVMNDAHKLFARELFEFADEINREVTHKALSNLDADIRSFFDSVDHECLMRMVAHRIADPRILNLIRMWLVAGVLESNELHETERGAPQGPGISPLLANIFLHYVLDLWVHQWRRRHARGRVSVVRYADDFVMGFESKADADRMLVDLCNRLQQFGLTLHENKARLIEFGRLPALKRAKLGLPRPRTFAFLGFSHYCGWTQDGRFIVKHKTQSKRITRKLTELRRDAWRRMHDSLANQHRWYVSVLRGHCAYYGMLHNWRALAEFLQQLRRI